MCKSIFQAISILFIEKKKENIEVLRDPSLLAQF